MYAGARSVWYDRDHCKDSLGLPEVVMEPQHSNPRAEVGIKRESTLQITSLLLDKSSSSKNKTKQPPPPNVICFD